MSEETNPNAKLEELLTQQLVALNGLHDELSLLRRGKPGGVEDGMAIKRVTFNRSVHVYGSPKNSLAANDMRLNGQTRMWWDSDGFVICERDEVRAGPNGRPRSVALRETIPRESLQTIEFMDSVISAGISATPGPAPVAGPEPEPEPSPLDVDDAPDEGMEVAAPQGEDPFDLGEPPEPVPTIGSDGKLLPLSSIEPPAYADGRGGGSGRVPEADGLTVTADPKPAGATKKKAKKKTKRKTKKKTTKRKTRKTQKTQTPPQPEA